MGNSQNTQSVQIKQSAQNAQSVQNTQNEKDLLKAARKNDIDTIKRLVNQNNVNTRDVKLGGTLLIWAAVRGYYDLCLVLLEKGANVNLQSNERYTALINAAHNGHVDTCKILLERGADINLQNIYGNTPLLVAIIENQLSTCKYLLEHNADVNIKNNKGKSAIDLAKETQNEDIIILINEYTNKHNADKKIKEARVQLKLLEIERIIKIKKEKLKKIEEYNQLKKLTNEKEEKNNEIQKSIDLLLSIMEQKNNFLKTHSSEVDLSNVLLDTNTQYEEKVNSLLEQQATNTQIISRNQDEMKQNEVKTENYEHLKQELEQIENRFKEGKYDEIIQDIDKDCPICFEEMRSPIYQCSEGHVLCDQCFHQICTTTKKCPFCGQLFDINNRIRSRVLEEIIMNDTKREAKI